MKIQSLNGRWDYRVLGGRQKKIKVPFSSLAVGRFYCEKTFSLKYNSDKIFIKFDRITYQANVTLNGKFLGVLGPYAEYFFDVTDIVKKCDNRIVVEVFDLTPKFGPSEGWENYGGIIGDVSVLFRGDTYIDDVTFTSTLKNNYQDANYSLKIAHGGVKQGHYAVKLIFKGKAVDSFTVPVGEDLVDKEVKNVSLWSPSAPTLYTLKIDLIVDGKILDSYQEKVGFREFTCNRHRFLLNGQEVFLHGVCRHEMILDYGHTVPYKLVKNDLIRIKSLGCNYVRLVHYPHNKKTLELCDSIGLMTSEEPGLWWSNTADKDVADGSLDVLRRTIKRDKNHPSIVFWLCFNECEFTKDFLVKSANVCKNLDPTRLVSGANCMSNEDTLKYYNLCNFDFYTMHPYAPTVDMALESAKVLHDKPLMFTEWGGFFVYDNPHLITDFIGEFRRLYEQNSDDGALAGACFWYFREVNDFGRGEPACIDGTLKEALVDRYGKKTLIYDSYVSAYKKVNKNYDDLFDISIDKQGVKGLKSKKVFGAKTDVDLDKLKTYANDVDIKNLSHLRGRKIVKGPILQTPFTGVNSIPYLIDDNNVIEFIGESLTDTITILGAVSLKKGHPYSGDFGEVAFSVDIECKDGKTFTFDFKNGIDFTSAFTSIGSSRVKVIGENCKKVADFSYDKNFENYQINRLDIKLLSKTTVQKITITSKNKGYVYLIYGVLG